MQTNELDLSSEEKKALLGLARQAVELYVREGVVLQPPASLREQFPRLCQPRSCFVTLHEDGELRGCIGSLEPRRPLLDEVCHNAVAAAIHDTRFVPVSAKELGRLEYEISVLQRPEPLRDVAPEQLPAYLAQHRPGVVIEYRGRRSTFLPCVWEDLPDPVEFLARLCRKQGSPVDCWREADAKISTYGSVQFSESQTH